MNQGTDGSLEVSYRVYLKDGEPIGKSEISRLVLSEPTDKIIRIGSGAKDSIEIKEKEIIINGTAYPFRAVYDMRATAYSLGKRTATGTPTHRGVVAVDPSVIPYFSRLFIISSDGTSWSYGFASAEDTGSSIKGNKIDLFMDGMALARRFGVKSCKVYVLK